MLFEVLIGKVRRHSGGTLAALEHGGAAMVRQSTHS